MSDGAARAKTGGAGLKIVIALIFVGGLIAFLAFGGQRYLNLETLKANRDLLLDFTAKHYALTILIAFGVYVVSTALSVPGALILSLACGFLFGRWVGTALIVAGATVGATLVFLAARYLFADAARARITQMGGLAERINQGFTHNAFNYLLFLRLVPLFPFWLVNLAPAFSSVPVRTYVLATAIGIVPGSFVFANLGQSLGRISSTKDLISIEIIVAFVLLGLFALAPIGIQRFKGK